VLNVFDSLWDFLTTCRWRRDLLFQFRLQIFRLRVRIFSLFFLCCFYFLLKVHVTFSSVFYRDYRAVVTSSWHLPFSFHNFVFLLNCLLVLYNAHRISVCVIAVSHTNFCWKFVDFHFFDDDAYAFMSTRHNFFTTTQGIRLQQRVNVFTWHRTLVQKHLRRLILGWASWDKNGGEALALVTSQQSSITYCQQAHVMPQS